MSDISSSVDNTTLVSGINYRITYSTRGINKTDGQERLARICILRILLNINKILVKKKKKSKTQ